MEKDDVHLSIFPSIHLSIYPSTNASIYQCMHASILIFFSKKGDDKKWNALPKEKRLGEKKYLITHVSSVDKRKKLLNRKILFASPYAENHINDNFLQKGADLTTWDNGPVFITTKHQGSVSNELVDIFGIYIA